MDPGAEPLGALRALLQALRVLPDIVLKELIMLGSLIFLDVSDPSLRSHRSSMSAVFMYTNFPPGNFIMATSRSLASSGTFQASTSKSCRAEGYGAARPGGGFISKTRGA